jgi:hypothetical protein
MNKLTKILMLLILIAIAITLVTGCATLNSIQDKWGPPAKCEPKGELTVCYWYYWLGDGPAPTTVDIYSPDWKCREVTVNKNGRVIKVRRYWIQPKL